MEYEFKGVKQKSASRYDRVSVRTDYDGVVTIYAYCGVFRDGHASDVMPATARAIAAALIAAADEAEAGQ
jgi:hypothetical protein